MHARPPANTRGFTLIELMVVVVIIGLVTALIIPTVLGQLESRSDPPKQAESTLSQAPPRARVLDGSEAGTAAPIELTEIEIDLEAEPVLDGFVVHNRYDAQLHGRFRVRNPDPKLAVLEVYFPFPPGLLEARDVQLRIDRGDGRIEVPARVVYSLDGIRWRGAVNPGAAVDLLVDYAAGGRDALHLDVTGDDRSGRVRVELRLAGIDSVTIPSAALQPGELADDRVIWEFDKLVTASTIAVELPAGDSPLGRLILLCQLAGLGVLLFGAGLWFLAEGYRPGLLDDFRWGHFLLAALNYALFFAIFAVVGFFGRAELALLVASVVALPLLTLHMRRVVDGHFAIARALPMSTLTLLVVVAGVYLDASRPYVLLGAGVFVTGFVTVSYDRWSAGRLASARARERRAARTGRETELRARLAELAEREATATTQRSRAAELLASAGEQRRAAGERLAIEQVELERTLARADASRIDPTQLDELDDDAHARACEHAGRQLGELVADLDDLAARHDRARAQLAERLERERSEQAEAGEALARCLDLADELLARAHSRDGEALSLREQVEAGRQLLLAAGIRRRTLDQARERCELALTRVQAALTRHGLAGTNHCQSCGSPLDSTSSFCSACGGARAIELPCAGCHAHTVVPVELLDLDWAEDSGVTLHCRACGTAHPREQLPRGRRATRMS